ncbi:MAG: c-type cytochrome [Hyphomicrobiaceae bacterium]
MDSHEWNKIIGSVLGTVLFILVVRAVGEAIFFAEEPEEPAIAIAGAEKAPAEAAGTAQAESLPDFAVAIPAADAMSGGMFAERCMVCHTWMKGAPSTIGPNLYGVVGRPKASEAGFDYSPALREKGGNWTYEELFNFLHQPGVYAPGTKMAFAGVPRTQDKLNLIAFLRMQADQPAPLPGGGAAP